MSKRYLLPCPECSQPLPVDASQAGLKVSCRCGASVAVPTLRGLSALPTEERAAGAAPARRWGVRHRLVLVGLLQAAAGFGLAESLRRSPPRLERPDALAEVAVDRLSPRETMELWEQLSLGIVHPSDRRHLHVWRQQMENHRRLTNACRLVGGVGLLLALVAPWLVRADQPVGKAPATRPAASEP